MESGKNLGGAWESLGEAWEKLGRSLGGASEVLEESGWSGRSLGELGRSLGRHLWAGEQKYGILRGTMWAGEQ